MNAIVKLAAKTWDVIVNRLADCRQEMGKKNAIIKAYEKQIRDYQKEYQDG